MSMKIDITFRDIFPYLVQQLTNVNQSGLWRMVTPMMDRATADIFDNQGGTWGRQKWLPISKKLYGKIRKGTDGRAHGLYSEASRPLQASGKYRASFRRISARPLSMTYGSNYRFAGKSGDILPHAGRGGRFPLPNPESGRFKAELGMVEDAFLIKTIALSVAQAAVKKVTG